jgi:glycosyltransferase involved in cell wall biosynthesis
MGSEPRDSTRDLTVVMPVYNEADCIEACVCSWVEQLSELGIRYRIDIYDDGSTDDTAQVLASVARLPCVRVEKKSNEGHGPTILRGYRNAVAESVWVLQVDSDDEIPASAFPSVWALAGEADAVLGVRVGRQPAMLRLVISKVAAATTRVLFSSPVRDANVPFRLIRSSVLAPIVDRIPLDTFAPNVVISGALGRNGVRLREVEVPFVPRRTGTVSLRGFRTVREAARSFWQTARLARTFR